MSDFVEDGPPPKYSEAPGPLNDESEPRDGGTREAFLGGMGAVGGVRKTSEDGLEVGREELRLAGIEQRKALWWKNTLVTGMFIASW